jgi:GNAT superfamily N-acetyltransferase
MRPHVERTWGAWDEADQRRRFDETTDPTTHEIVLLGDEPVGCQWVREHDDSLELVRVYLLPEHQGRGVGTRLVARLRRRAADAGLPLRLRVLRESPARRLYARLGFVETAETEWHVEMEATPDAPLPPGALW